MAGGVVGAPQADVGHRGIEDVRTDAMRTVPRPGARQHGQVGDESEAPGIIATGTQHRFVGGWIRPVRLQCQPGTEGEVQRGYRIRCDHPVATIDQLRDHGLWKANTRTPV